MHLLVRLLDERLAVGEAPCHHSAHNEIERFCPGPVLLKVVDLE